jgi:hypothetical protein
MLWGLGAHTSYFEDPRIGFASFLQTSLTKSLFTYLFHGSFNDAFDISDYIVSNGRIINEWWIGNDVEGSRSDLFQDTIPAFAWWSWEKSRKSLISIIVVPGEIWTSHFPNTNHKRYRLNRISRWSNHNWGELGISSESKCTRAVL